MGQRREPRHASITTYCNNYNAITTIDTTIGTTIDTTVDTAIAFLHSTASILERRLQIAAFTL